MDVEGVLSRDYKKRSNFLDGKDLGSIVAQNRRDILKVAEILEEIKCGRTKVESGKFDVKSKYFAGDEVLQIRS